MTATGRYRISAYTEAEWLQGRSQPAHCPNCGHEGSAEAALAVFHHPPGLDLDYHLLRCPACTVLFVDTLPVVDYGRDELIEIGWPPYYAQMGAGTWPIASALARIVKPAGARVLEVGGAYGFGLDFCVHGKGWQGVGYDPSPLAAIGAKALELPVIQGFFTEETLRDGPWDVIVGTELIEHINEPPEFLRLMRRAIAEDGVLMLTTPAADFITPALAPLELDALIVPAAHVVLQSVASMERALRDAGFAHVAVRQKRSALVAYASPAPLALDEDQGAAWRAYRGYMEARAARAPVGSDIQFGFAGRAMFDAANDADEAACESAWAMLNAGAQARYGYRLEELTALPDGAASAQLEGLGEKMPHGLGMILFARAMQRLARGESRAAVRPLMALALQAVEALQAALGRRSLGDDLLSSSVGEVLRLELLLCDAEAGAPGVAEALIARGDMVGGWRGFVALVNVGNIEAAGRLREAMLGAAPDAALPAGLRRNALMSLANFHLTGDADPMPALAAAQALEALGEDVTALRLEAFVRLVNRGDYAAAQALASSFDILGRAAETGGRLAQDARLAGAVLALSAGDPLSVPIWVEGLDPARQGELLADGFVRAVNAGRYQPARDFAQAQGLFTRAVLPCGRAAMDLALARATLELVDGDAAAVAPLLDGLAPDQARPLCLDAFTRLVNQARYDEARALAASQPALQALAEQPGAAAADARLASVILALHTGENARAAAQALAFAALDGPAKLQPLYVQAFLQAMNDGDFETARQLAGAALTACLPACAAPRRQDALVALLLLDLQPDGAVSRLPDRLAALEAAGLPSARYQTLAFNVFTRLVNAGEAEAARALLPRLTPLMAALQPPMDQPARDALFCAGMLHLQRPETQRLALGVLARLREDLLRQAPPGGPAHPLFWPALRGEVIALFALTRGEEAVGLLKDYRQAYDGMPEDLLLVLEPQNA